MRKEQVRHEGWEPQIVPLLRWKDDCRFGWGYPGVKYNPFQMTPCCSALKLSLAVKFC